MQIDHVQFPLVLPPTPFKRSAKVALGRLLGTMHHRRVAQLLAGDVGDRLSALDRLLVAHLVDRHERGGSLDRLAALQRWVWTCDQAVSFHAQAEARFERWWRRGAACIVPPLQAAVDAAPAGYARLCEIGCGSGLVLNDLRATLRGVSSFLGLDLSPTQVARNRTRFGDSAGGPSLTFAAGDATAWIPAHAEPGWVYLTNAGVLEYLTEPQVAELFAHVAHRLRPAVFALVEPIAPDHDVARELRSRPFGAERTFSHSYLHLLERAGWRVTWSDVRAIEGTRMHYVVATAR